MRFPSRSKPEPAQSTLLTIYTCPFEPQTLQFRLACRLKVVPLYRIVVLPETKPAWFARASPDGKLPLLKTSEKHFLNDVLDSIAYIDRLFPDAPSSCLYPPGIDKTLVHKWAMWVQDRFMPSFEKVLLNGSGAVQGLCRPILLDCYNLMSVQLEASGGPWFFGDHYSIIDALITPFAARRPLMIYLRAWDGAAGTLVVLEYFNRLVESPAHKEIGYPYEDMKRSFKARMAWLPPVSICRLEHDSQRAHLNQSMEILKNGNDTALTRLTKLKMHFTQLSAFMTYHTLCESDVLVPFLKRNGTDIGLLENITSEHHNLDIMIKNFLSIVDAAITDLTEESMASTLNLLIEVVSALHEHLQQEEVEVISWLTKLPIEIQFSLFRDLLGYDPSDMIELLPFILRGLNPPQRAQYLCTLQQVLGPKSPEYARALASIKRGLTDAEYSDVVERVPEHDETSEAIRLRATPMGSGRNPAFNITPPSLDRNIPSRQTDRSDSLLVARESVVGQMLLQGEAVPAREPFFGHSAALQQQQYHPGPRRSIVEGLAAATESAPVLGLDGKVAGRRPSAHTLGEERPRVPIRVKSDIPLDPSETHQLEREHEYGGNVPHAAENSAGAGEVSIRVRTSSLSLGDQPPVVVKKRFQLGRFKK
ncbi:hypothetical protein M427DRAFT_131329 [Gonapodya prolifera JEL478]|uniref:GST N-terminal domain-containing protein n=1 Tax=Gonapodya prolifera (strain JEL478) TaxID=1344416 RepID=A0A139AUX6_GONPJ|nr:hypothetical protein M427DRAFT_131329 [Gonapodya prolifera JEL478]|eukprot:KXS20546.1 hypothetical protein M427DRAFT_131329 [Gonapodya prolifera JEL478]